MDGRQRIDLTECSRLIRYGTSYSDLCQANANIQGVSSVTNIQGVSSVVSVVAAKVIRGVPTKSEYDRLTTALADAVCVWGEMNHRNVYHVLGLGVFPQGEFAITMPFCDEGNILDYINNHSDVDKFSLIRDFAAGLEYIHSLNVIHGNIKPENVLIRKGVACISDVGIERKVQRQTLLESGRAPIASGWRYQLHEELCPQNPEADIVFSAGGDVCAFAHCVFHIYTGKAARPARWAADVVRNFNMQLVQRPNQIPSRMWDLLQRCWASNPPSMPKVNRELQNMGRD